MYGMNGTIPAIVNRIDGSAETREALGTISCCFYAKWSRNRRWISEVRMGVVLQSGGRTRMDGDGQGGEDTDAPVRVLAVHLPGRVSRPMASQSSGARVDATRDPRRDQRA
jgi:hypothetical protein